jgi:hypothetical protein
MCEAPSRVKLAIVRLRSRGRSASWGELDLPHRAHVHSDRSAPPQWPQKAASSGSAAWQVGHFIRRAPSRPARRGSGRRSRGTADALAELAFAGGFVSGQLGQLGTLDVEKRLVAFRARHRSRATPRATRLAPRPHDRSAGRCLTSGSGSSSPSRCIADSCWDSDDRSLQARAVARFEAQLTPTDCAAPINRRRAETLAPRQVSRSCTRRGASRGWQLRRWPESSRKTVRFVLVKCAFWASLGG